MTPGWANNKEINERKFVSKVRNIINFYHPGRYLPLSIMLALFLMGVLMPEIGICQEEEDLSTKQALLNYKMDQPEKTVALDRPIDPSTYFIGPGDKLRIFIWGDIQAQYDVTITPEGKVLIPTVGPVNISNMLLSDAKLEIKNSVLKRFRNVEVTTDLMALRSFKVSVGGAVNLPGVYTANAVTRVSEIITMAGGFLGEQVDENKYRDISEPLIVPSGVASHRNIIVRRITGNVDTADVLLFEQAGDLRYDYKVVDGDEIFVPLREQEINLYGVFGGVRNPAFFEYSYRDSLTDLIKLAHGLTLNADSSKAELVRFNPDGKTTRSESIDLKQILAGEAPNMLMKPDDRVYIKIISDFNEKDQVLVLGEVQHPGFYAIIPDSTRLSQLIREAGGFTKSASLAEAEMTRFVDKNIADREFERLKQMNVADMSDLEYEYFKVKSREKPGRVAVDFQALYDKSGVNDIKLRNGDVILIPKVSQVVNVSGEVANPGLLAYRPEYNYLDYIDLAGGYSFRANKGKVRIIRAVTGEWKKAKKGTLLKPGDTILIPEKKKWDYFTTIKDIIAVTANVATIYLVIKQATQ
jgi:protein involved in polysaccharide export with SLBB domain